MIKTLLSPLTTATKTGTAVRDIVMVLGAVLTMLGLAGLLTPQQIDQIKAQIDVLTRPEMMTALGTVMTLGISIYRNFTKSTTDRAAEVAKKIDSKVPETAPLVIQTPAGMDNIFVPGKDA